MATADYWIGNRLERVYLAHLEFRGIRLQSSTHFRQIQMIGIVLLHHIVLQIRAGKRSSLAP
jgi:hypothetical protein